MFSTNPRLQRIIDNRKLYDDKKLTDEQFKTQQKMAVVFCILEEIEIPEISKVLGNKDQNLFNDAINYCNEKERLKNEKLQTLRLNSYLLKKREIEPEQYVKDQIKKILEALNALATYEEIMIQMQDGNVDYAKQHKILDKFFEYYEANKVFMGPETQLIVENFRLEIQLLQNPEAKAQPKLLKTDEVASIIPIIDEKDMVMDEDNTLIKTMRQNLLLKENYGLREYQQRQTMAVVFALQENIPILKIKGALSSDSNFDFVGKARSFLSNTAQNRNDMYFNLKDNVAKLKSKEGELKEYREAQKYSLVRYMDNFGTLQSMRTVLGDAEHGLINEMLEFARVEAQRLCTSTVETDRLAATNRFLLIENFERCMRLERLYQHRENQQAGHTHIKNLIALRNRFDFAMAEHTKEIKTAADAAKAAEESASKLAFTSRKKPSAPVKPSKPKTPSMVTENSFSSELAEQQELLKQAAKDLEDIRKKTLASADANFTNAYNTANANFARTKADLETKMVSELKAYRKTLPKDEKAGGKRPALTHDVLKEVPIGIACAWKQGLFKKDYLKKKGEIDALIKEGLDKGLIGKADIEGLTADDFLKMADFLKKKVAEHKQVVGNAATKPASPDLLSGDALQELASQPVATAETPAAAELFDWSRLGV